MSQNLLYKVAYEEAVRALSEQQAVIDSFRNRAGMLFSAAAIATSFLGGQALHGGNAASSPFLVASGLLMLEVILWMIAIVISL